ncbi:WbqC-like protein family protein [Winogradskyella jejuensis]|uniref:WbqC-like protein family protein n=2 Tax=Winogradskyella jejuensis TaxID=1089305 RepID=A0A1M5JQM1_9FLAO|nr:WbqC-like protein family protein [Winogradskyella jejuensis]
MLLHPTYFPNISHFVAMLKDNAITFEVCDNYQKQTFRNRCDIYSANGKLSLTIPVSYTQKKRQQYKDVEVSTTENWQLQHIKSLDSAYRMSPFYEFYIDDLVPLFQRKFKYLLDVNLKCFELLSECLEVSLDYKLTEDFILPNTTEDDFRYLANSKKLPDLNFDTYTQVFSEKHGYLSNLSILDLLFNEGPNSVNYLENQIRHL